jgi:hypothetical protein
MPSAATRAIVLQTSEEEIMDRLLIVARLRQGKHEEAEKLLREGPPFDPEDLGLHRHGAYLTSSEVVFVFEGPEVEWKVNDLIDDPIVASSFAPWHSLIETPPRLAHERYHWSREEAKLGVGLGV